MTRHRPLPAVAPLTPAGHAFMCRCSDVEHVLDPHCYRPGRPPALAEPEPPDNGLFAVPYSPHATYRTLARGATTMAEYARWRAVLANLPDAPDPDDLDPAEVIENYPAVAAAHVLEILADAELGWADGDRQAVADALDVKVETVPTMEPPEETEVDHDAAVAHVLEAIAGVPISGPTRLAMAEALDVAAEKIGAARTRKKITTDMSEVQR